MTTGLYDIYKLFGNHIGITASVLFVVSAMAIVSIFIYDKFPIASLWLLLPQQGIMIVSALTAWRCIRDGTFADGAQYDALFISADQCYVFVIGIVHTLLIIHVYLWSAVFAAFAIKVRS